jgi:hypothetical protein
MNRRSKIGWVAGVLTIGVANYIAPPAGAGTLPPGYSPYIDVYTFFLSNPLVTSVDATPLYDNVTTGNDANGGICLDLVAGYQS